MNEGGQRACAMWALWAREEGTVELADCDDDAQCARPSEGRERRADRGANCAHLAHHAWLSLEPRKEPYFYNDQRVSQN